MWLLSSPLAWLYTRRLLAGSPADDLRPCEVLPPHGLPSPSSPGCLFRVPMASSPRVISQWSHLAVLVIGSHGLTVMRGDGHTHRCLRETQLRALTGGQRQGSLATQSKKYMDLEGWAVVRKRRGKLQGAKVCVLRVGRVQGGRREAQRKSCEGGFSGWFSLGD